MFQYDEHMQKNPVKENYQHSQKRVRFQNTVENYGSDNNKKQSKWLWIVLGVVGVLLLIVLVVLLVRSRKSNKYSSMSNNLASAGFGFRFY